MSKILKTFLATLIVFTISTVVALSIMFSIIFLVGRNLDWIMGAGLVGIIFGLVYWSIWIEE